MTWWHWLTRQFLVGIPTETRSAPPWTTTQSGSDFRALFDNVTSLSAAGVTVTPEIAMTVPAVFACTTVLAQDVARCPIQLKQQTAPDTFIDATDHPLYEILGSLPNPETSAYSFKLQLMRDLLAHERAYAEIVRTPDGRITALWRLDPERVRVDRTPGRVKRWTYHGQTDVTWLFDPSKPPIFELTHPSPIHQCADVIGSALALQTYVGKFFANGARPTGVLQAPGEIHQSTAEKLALQWKAILSSSGTNPRGVAVLDKGLEFKPIASENDNAQLNETLHALTTQIAGAFRIPPWKIGDLANANYSNMESSELNYTVSVLDPYFQLWEDALRRDLLTTRQYPSYTITFDRSALVRNDIKALHESLAVGRNSGFYSVNDCRRKLGENPIANGDQYLVNSALQPVGAPREPTIA